MKLSEMSKNDTKKESPNNQKNINQAYDDLKGCSSDDLMSRLSKEIQSQKANGTFDYQALRKSIDSIKIYLPQPTYENMIRIIDGLR